MGTAYIDRWIRSGKENESFPVDRRGYRTNLTAGSGPAESCFTEVSRHSTIRAETAFAQGEQVEVAMETIYASERRQGVRQFVTAFHNHDFFELIYVYRGRCTTTIEGEARELGEGDLCIYNMEAVHQLGITDEDSVVFNILMKRELFDSTFIQLIDSAGAVSGFFMRSLYSIASPAAHLVFSLSREDSGSESLHRIIAEYIGRQSMYRNMMISSLAGLFISLSRQYQSRMAELSGGEARADILRILSYMAVHYRDVTLPELSARFGYTPRSMMRLIKKCTYRTFNDILTEFRMSVACRLLQEDGKTIEEIALATGYGDRSYFDRVFTRFHHITPAKYRRERRLSPPDIRG